MSSPSLPIATALVWALFISHLNRRDNLSSGVLTDQSPADSYPLSLSIILAAGMVFLKGKSDHVPSGLKPFDKSPFFQGDMHTPAWHWRLLGLISKHSSNLFSCYVTWDPPHPRLNSSLPHPFSVPITCSFWIHQAATYLRFLILFFRMLHPFFTSLALILEDNVKDHLISEIFSDPPLPPPHGQ